MSSIAASSYEKSSSDEKKTSKVALAGNPNSGKTTIFNALTGLSYKVGNYPGVTVEKKQGNVFLADNFLAEIYDLPGTYTLYGESIDEQVAAKALADAPDLLVVILDASNLERNLYLLSELIDLGFAIVVGLNMVDLAEDRGIVVYEVPLSRALDLPVVRLTASKKKGIEDLKLEISKALETKKSSSMKFTWADGNEELIHSARQRDIPANFGKVASARYKWINSIVKKSVAVQDGMAVRFSERVDLLATHRIWGLVFFLLVMTGLFQSIFSWAKAPMEFIEAMTTLTGNYINSLMPEGPLRSLLVDGVLAGVGSVVMFVPQIALLFFFIGILEDSGYLTRAAFVMDRVMRQVGLQGRSFIPLLSSFACAVPGIMSTRTIPSISDRFITILVAPLMSCSARLPVYTVLIAAFIPHKTIFGIFGLPGLVLLSAYVLGILGAGVAALFLKHFVFIGEPALYVMEMPPFRMPSLKLVLREVLDRVMLFIKDAGTVIMACSIVLWFLASFPLQESGARPKVTDSYAGSIGKAIEPAIKPLGFDWQIGIGILASFAAREVFISSLATVYNLEDSNDATESLTQKLKERSLSGEGFGLPTMLSLLVFFIFACQCMSTLAVCKRETGTWKWPAVMFIYMTTMAYVASFITYRLACNYL